MTGDRAGAAAPAVALQAPAADALRVLLVEDGDQPDLAEGLAAAAVTPRRVALAEALATGPSPLDEPCDLVIACLPAAHGAEALLIRLRRLLPAPAVLLLADGVDAQRELALLRAGCTEVLGDARRPLLHEAIGRMVASLEQRRALLEARGELLRSGQRFDAVFAHAPTAVLVVDATGYRLLEANPAARRMFDLAEAGLGDVALPQLVQPDDVDVLRAAVARLVDTGEPRVRIELRLRRSDSSVFWGDVSLACLQAAAGAPAGLIVNVLNISLHKQAEAAAAGMQAELERRVREKTADLVVQRRRVEALYAISSQVAAAQSVAQLCGEFVGALLQLAAADAAVLRRCDPHAGVGEVLAAAGAPVADCALCASCDVPACAAGPRVLEVRADAPRCLPPRARRVVRLPVVAQGRELAVLDLAYETGTQIPGPGELLLLEAAVGHLAAGLEGLRSAALEREAAVAVERGLLARELHDSIAQALAFMNIQIDLLRGGLRAGDPARMEHALQELEAGLRESSEDVRELLLHFRTRTNADDIAPAIRSTLQKFELQCAVPVQLEIDTHGRALDADVQVQLLHILQEALSNVRKHARATRVLVRVDSLPRWRIEVRDDGRGFDPSAAGRGSAAHVGLQIMRERAGQIGASVRVRSRPGEGTEVIVELDAGGAPVGASAGAHDGRAG